MLKESYYNIYDRNGSVDRLYNSISKASAECINEGTILSNLDKMKSDEVDLLKENGFLVDDDFREQGMIRYLFLKNLYSDKILNVVLVPGLECNFDCPYCFEKNLKKRYKRNIETYFSTLRKYAEQYFGEYELIEISLFGGEPLLFYEECSAFLSWVEKKWKEKEICTSIVTNGALLTEKVALDLIKHNCRSIQITIDGDKEKHNQTRCFKNGSRSYDLLMENINCCLKLIPDSTRFNLRINLNNIAVKRVKTTLDDIDINFRNKVSVLFRPIYNTSCFKQINENNFTELESFYKIANDMGFKIVQNSYLYQACESCSGTNFYYIMPDLSIWKCINDLSYDKACIGQIDNNGIIKFNLTNFLDWLDNADCTADVKCRKCKLMPDCYGGCTLYRSKNGKRSCKEFAMCSVPYMYEGDQNP